jgi:Flp pilus assembly protein TadD
MSLQHQTELNAEPSTAEQTDQLIEEWGRNFDQLVQRLTAGSRVRVLDDEVQEALYGVAYTALSGRNYKKSVALFSFLAAQRPTEGRFMAGLGHSQAGLGQHASAVVAFALAYHFEPDNARHLLSMAEALLALDEGEMARHILRVLEAATDGKAGSEALFERARTLSRIIKNAHQTPAPTASR